MGFFRNSAMVVACNLFLITILLGNLFLVASISLKYENVKKTLTPVVMNVVRAQVNLDLMGDYQQYCGEQVFNFQGQEYNVSVPCDDIEKNIETVIEENVNRTIYGLYYKSYDCKFFDCLRESPFFLLSEKAMQFWRKQFYISLVVSFIFFFIIFLLAKQKPNAFILAGAILTVCSFFFFKLDWILSLIVRKLRLPFESVNILAGDSVIFYRLLIVGIVLVVAGILLKVLKIQLGILSRLRIERPKKIEEAKKPKEVKKSEIKKPEPKKPEEKKSKNKDKNVQKLL